MKLIYLLICLTLIACGKKSDHSGQAKRVVFLWAGEQPEKFISKSTGTSSLTDWNAIREKINEYVKNEKLTLLCKRTVGIDLGSSKDLRNPDMTMVVVLNQVLEEEVELREAKKGIAFYIQEKDGFIVVPRDIEFSNDSLILKPHLEKKSVGIAFEQSIGNSSSSASFPLIHR